MSNFIEIKPEEFEKSAFKLIGSDWMLITAEKNNRINALTAAWGGFGFMFNKNVVFIVLRPHRYTKEFVDGSDTFSLTFFNEGFKKNFNYFGSVSGRNEDKISKAGLTVVHSGLTPYFEEAAAAIICKKLYAQEFKPECFIATDLDKKFYPDKDYHTMYIAEVKRLLVKE